MQLAEEVNVEEGTATFCLSSILPTPFFASSCRLPALVYLPMLVPLAPRLLLLLFLYRCSLPETCISLLVGFPLRCRFGVVPKLSDSPPPDVVVKAGPILGIGFGYF